MQSDPRPNSYKWDETLKHNPQKNPSNTPDGVQASASQLPDPH
jgi:hypothetical protein